MGELIAELRTIAGSLRRGRWLTKGEEDRIDQAADELSALRERVAALEDHIREQSDHVRTRIKDGDELGARVWRIALEDVLHENFTALARAALSSAIGEPSA